MAAHGWRKSTSVEDWLFDESYAFDFYQAVSLLEKLRRDATSVGTGINPHDEAVTFSSNVGLAFPETDIARIGRPHRETDPARMLVNFLGLAGALGPLPAPFAETIFQRAVRGDTAARDFLDIFNHRLVSLAYRIRKNHRVGLGVNAPPEDSAAKHLFALLGLADETMKDRLPFKDRALLEHTATFSNETRSLEGLLAVLRRHFALPIEAIPLTGAFHPIEKEDRSALGPSGGNRTLGRDACLGTRFWDQEATFDLRIGPLNFEEFKRFLPGGDALSPFCALVRLYAGERFHFGLVLILAAGEAPPLTLGKKGSSRLGQVAWIGRSKLAHGQDSEVRLSRAAMKKVLATTPPPEENNGGPSSIPPESPPNLPLEAKPLDVKPVDVKPVDVKPMDSAPVVAPLAPAEDEWAVMDEAPPTPPTPPKKAPPVVAAPPAPAPPVAKPAAAPAVPRPPVVAPKPAGVMPKPPPLPPKKK